MKPLMALSEAELIRLLPARSGILLVKSVRCPAGQSAGERLRLEPGTSGAADLPSLRHGFPHADYPANRTVTVDAAVRPDADLRVSP